MKEKIDCNKMKEIMEERMQTQFLYWFGNVMCYLEEMISKGMVLEPRTEKLVSSMNIRLKGRTEK